MYPLISTDAELFANGTPQLAEIIVTPLTGSTFTITDAELVSGGLSLNRYSASGSVIQIGCCSAAELTLKINNRTGAYNNKVFQGARIYAKVKVPRGTTPETYAICPLGYFTVDNAPRMLSTITLTALDSMVKFDKVVDYNLVGQTVIGAVQICCQRCGVTLNSEIEYQQFPNYGYMLTYIPDDPDLTYRQLMIWLCQIMGVNAYIDYYDELILAFYEYGQTDDFTLTPADRFSSDLYEDAITLTGLNIKVGDTTVSVGNSGYVLSIDGNQLITETAASTLASNLWTWLNGFTYHPYSANVLPMPHVYPMDTVSYTDGQGNTFRTIVTEVTFSINNRTMLRATGETKETRGYASLGTLTPGQKAIIESVRTSVENDISSVEQAMLHMNDIAANTLGFFTTEEPQPDGSTIVYWHDQPTLAGSTTVYKMGADGFFVSQDGGVSYTQGFDADGDAVVNILSAIEINANWLNINDVINRINNDGTQTINGAQVSIDGNGLSSVVSQLRTDVDTNTQNFENYTTLTQTSEAISISASSVLETVEGDYTKKEDLRMYFDFLASGLDIHAPDSPYRTHIDDDSLDIMENDTVLASFSISGTYTPAITINDGLYLPPLQLNAYATGWVVTKSTS